MAAIGCEQGPASRALGDRIEGAYVGDDEVTNALGVRRALVHEPVVVEGPHFDRRGARVEQLVRFTSVGVSGPDHARSVADRDLFLGGVPRHARRLIDIDRNAFEGPEVDDVDPFATRSIVVRDDDRCPDATRLGRHRILAPEAPSDALFAKSDVMRRGGREQRSHGSLDVEASGHLASRCLDGQQHSQVGILGNGLLGRDAQEASGVDQRLAFGLVSQQIGLGCRIGSVDGRGVGRGSGRVGLRGGGDCVVGQHLGGGRLVVRP